MGGGEGGVGGEEGLGLARMASDVTLNDWIAPAPSVVVGEERGRERAGGVGGEGRGGGGKAIMIDAGGLGSLDDEISKAKQRDEEARDRAKRQREDAAKEREREKEREKEKEKEREKERVLRG